MDWRRARLVLEASLLRGGISKETFLADQHADGCADCAASRERLYARLADEAFEQAGRTPDGLEDRLVANLRARRRQGIVRYALTGVVLAGIVLGASLVQRNHYEAARGREDESRRADAIEQRVRQDRALFASDAMGGSPAVAFAGYVKAGYAKR